MNAIGLVTVGEAGDVAIPQSICERAGFRPGAELIVGKDGDGEVWLRQAENGVAESLAEETTMSGKAELIKENGFWVIRGVPAALLENIVAGEREARVNELIKRVMNPEEDALESSA